MVAQVRLHLVDADPFQCQPLVADLFSGGVVSHRNADPSIPHFPVHGLFLGFSGGFGVAGLGGGGRDGHDDGGRDDGGRDDGGRDGCDGCDGRDGRDGCDGCDGRLMAQRRGWLMAQRHDGRDGWLAAQRRGWLVAQRLSLPLPGTIPFAIHWFPTVFDTTVQRFRGWLATQRRGWLATQRRGSNIQLFRQ